MKSNMFLTTFNQLPQERKTKLLVVLIILSVATIIIGRSIVGQYKLSKEQTFVLARISDIQDNKSSPHYYIDYNFLNKKYRNGFKPGFNYNKKIGDYLFIKILPSNPNIYSRQENEVPECLQTDRYLDTFFIAIDNTVTNICK